MESILEVKDLQKNYGDFAAVKGITFDIKEGEILLGEGLRPSRSLTGGLPFPAEITRWSALSPFRSRVACRQTRSIGEM